MFYAIPLEHRPNWRNPPWMTVLLIVVNMIVFWGPQRSEENARDRAATFYVGSPLPAIEVPRFVAWLEETGDKHLKEARALQKAGNHRMLLRWMEQEDDFQQRVKAPRFVPPEDLQYADWKSARSQYEARLPAPFTRKWAQSYAKDAEPNPVTWLTATFLHGSTGHLIGNMVFLFLFGFSVELALGRGAYLAFYLLGGIGGSLLAGWAYAGTGSYGLGASGAVSALMGMYAVLYRLRRVRFFYQLFFYFNYVTAPALILLPIWIANELVQHWLSGRGVAYMAHLGGLVTGASLMALTMLLRKKPLEVPVTQDVVEEDDGFDTHVANAQRLAKGMQFEKALTQWRAAAKLRPQDQQVLSAWFKTALLWPDGEDFHRAARRIFRLQAHDVATLDFQHTSYRTYLDKAKPGARLQPEDMARLSRRFARAQQWGDAEKLFNALHKTAPAHPELGETLGMLVSALCHAGRRDQAVAFEPQLRQLAPGSAGLQMLRGR
ncbi:MAG: rhomboid family intramembrane serine protease [Acidovorax sp.]|nr:rhomboid family intramembrane serine protease [Acidovorax sp.]